MSISPGVSDQDSTPLQRGPNEVEGLLLSERECDWEGYPRDDEFSHVSIKQLQTCVGVTNDMFYYQRCGDLKVSYPVYH